jgi:Raf kinase inhibitor-like YbhB/YbcL family protein
MRWPCVSLVVTMAMAMTAACGGGDDDGGSDGGASLVLTSSEIDQDGAFPIDYTCEGQDVSPPMAWEGGAGAAGFGVALVDETNGLIHWVLWDIPANVSSLPEGIEKTAEPDEPSGSKQSQAFDGATRGWLGPCPDETHDYLIRLYAVDEHPLPGVTLDTGRVDLLAALESSALAHADLRAAYQPQ